MTEVDTLQWGKDHGWTWNKTPWADAWEEAKHYESAKSPQSDSLIARYQDNAHWWWLRSPGDGPDFAAYVDNDGTVDLNGHLVDNSSGGIRPALWLNLES
jgi:hypothetical protein